MQCWHRVNIPILCKSSLWAWLVTLLRLSKGPYTPHDALQPCLVPYLVPICPLRSISFPSSISRAFVFSLSPSHTTRDGLMHAWCMGPHVKHPKLWCMHTTKHNDYHPVSRLSCNQTEQTTWFQLASHELGPALHPSSPSPQQSITSYVYVTSRWNIYTVLRTKQPSVLSTFRWVELCLLCSRN